MSDGDNRLGTIMTASMLLLIVGALLAILILCFWAPGISFVSRCSRAQWIMYPTEPTLGQQLVEVSRPDTTSFLRSFEAEPNKPLVLHFRALRTAKVFLNGKSVRFTASANWKRESTADVTALLRPGNNVLRVQVSSLRGPPLLCLYADGIPTLRTDGHWTAKFNQQPERNAVRADDGRRPEEDGGQPTAADWAVQRWPLLLLAFLVSCAAFLLRSRYPRWMRQNSGLVVMLAVTAAWVCVFFSNVQGIPLDVGFDARGHTDYIHYVHEKSRLPAPNELFSTYHPPLYYVLGALALAGGNQVSEDAGGAAVKGLGFLFGLAGVWMAYYLARSVFGERSSKTAVATLIAGLLPMNIYISAYPSNESTHAFFLGLALLLAVCAIKGPKARFWTCAAVGCAIGLAALSKYTVLLLAPLLIAALALKLVLVEKRSWANAAKLLLVMALIPLAIGGWFYIRTAIYTGSPLCGNWNLVLKGVTWWQQPGFHTSHYYLSFGESLVRPYACSWGSYWDSLYCTLWGDGQFAGLTSVIYAYGVWDYDLMSIVYLLALPATLLMGVGFVLGLRDMRRESDPSNRVIWWLIAMLILVVGVAMLIATLKLPYYGQAKAFYGLALLGPLALLMAKGFGALDDLLSRHRVQIGRALLYGWLGTLSIVIFITFTSA